MAFSMSSFKTMAVRSTSMMFTQYQISQGTWKPHHQISEGLFLGMIPIKAARFSSTFDNQHLEIIDLVKKSHPDRPLKLVVSAVELDELKGEGFMPVQAMVSPEDWKKENVEHHLLVIPDFTAKVKNEDVVNTIKKIRRCIIEDKGSVYVHCKAGRSRSAMLCAIYLSLYGVNPASPSEMKLENAVQLLKSKREQVELNTDQKLKAAEVIDILKLTINQDVKSVVPNQDIKCQDLKLDSINQKEESGNKVSEAPSKEANTQKMTL